MQADARETDMMVPAVFDMVRRYTPCAGYHRNQVGTDNSQILPYTTDRVPAQDEPTLPPLHQISIIIQLYIRECYSHANKQISSG